MFRLPGIKLSVVGRCFFYVRTKNVTLSLSDVQFQMCSWCLDVRQDLGLRMEEGAHLFQPNSARSGRVTTKCGRAEWSGGVEMGEIKTERAPKEREKTGRSKDSAWDGWHP
jgi:hypothetical protein